MRTNPAGLENDDPLFWKEIENFYLSNDVSYDNEQTLNLLAK
jgi:hypothetical protein